MIDEIQKSNLKGKLDTIDINTITGSIDDFIKYKDNICQFTQYLDFMFFADVISQITYSKDEEFHELLHSKILSDILPLPVLSDQLTQLSSIVNGMDGSFQDLKDKLDLELEKNRKLVIQTTNQSEDIHNLTNTQNDQIGKSNVLQKHIYNQEQNLQTSSPYKGRSIDLENDKTAEDFDKDLSPMKKIQLQSPAIQLLIHTNKSPRDEIPSPTRKKKQDELLSNPELLLDILTETEQKLSKTENLLDQKKRDVETKRKQLFKEHKIITGLVSDKQEYEKVIESQRLQIKELIEINLEQTISNNNSEAQTEKKELKDDVFAEQLQDKLDNIEFDLEKKLDGFELDLDCKISELQQVKSELDENRTLLEDKTNMHAEIVMKYENYISDFQIIEEQYNKKLQVLQNDLANAQDSYLIKFDENKSQNLKILQYEEIVVQLNDDILSLKNRQTQLENDDISSLKNRQTELENKLKLNDFPEHADSEENLKAIITEEEFLDILLKSGRISADEIQSMDSSFLKLHLDNFKREMTEEQKEIISSITPKIPKKDINEIESTVILNKPEPTIQTERNSINEKWIKELNHDNLKLLKDLATKDTQIETIEDDQTKAKKRYNNTNQKLQIAEQKLSQEEKKLNQLQSDKCISLFLKLKQSKAFNHYFFLILYTAGIFFGYISSSILVEEFMINKYKMYNLSMIAFSYFFNYIIACICRFIVNDSTSKLPTSKSMTYGALNCLSIQCVYKGFSEGSFFYGNLLRSGMTITTIFIAFLMGDFTYLKNQPLFTYIAVVIFTYGIANFFGAEANGSNMVVEHGHQVIACIFIFVSLISDSLLGNLQRKSLKLYQPSSLDLMKSQSKWAFVISFSVSCLSGEIQDAVEYWIENPHVSMQLLGITMQNSIGQIFIYAMLNNYGIIKQTMVLGIRKILTILLSLMIYKHQLNQSQNVALIWIIVSVFLEFMSKGGGLTKDLTNDLEKRVSSIKTKVTPSKKGSELKTNVAPVKEGIEPESRVRKTNMVKQIKTENLR